MGKHNDPAQSTKPKSKLDKEPIEAWVANSGSKNEYYNPNPLSRLTGKANESTIILDGEKNTALIDSGAQVTTITVDLVKKLGLPIYGLNTWLNFQGMGG